MERNVGVVRIATFKTSDPMAKERAISGTTSFPTSHRWNVKAKLKFGFDFDSARVGLLLALISSVFRAVVWLSLITGRKDMMASRLGNPII